MNPHDPESAQRIVADYAQLLESDAYEMPASVRHLPYPKQTIQTAILTCAATLRDSRQLTADMREFLESAYVALADYLDDDLVRVMQEYREAIAATADVRRTDEKIHSPAWKRISETSRLAGDIARTVAEDAAALRRDFRVRA
jgi:hypothetical protein